MTEEGFVTHQSSQFNYKFLALLALFTFGLIARANATLIKGSTNGNSPL